VSDYDGGLVGGGGGGAAGANCRSGNDIGVRQAI